MPIETKPTNPRKLSDWLTGKWDSDDSNRHRYLYCLYKNETFESICKDLSGKSIGNDGQKDAFRHAYWNALLAREFGQDWTLQYTTAHEAMPGNPAVREAMDLYNNEVGRDIAKKNKSADEKALTILIKQAVNDGKLVVVDQTGNLAWSNSIPLWQHSIASSSTAPGVIPVPDGTATAK